MISQTAVIIFSKSKLKTYDQTTGQSISNSIYLEKSKVIGHQNYKLVFLAKTVQPLLLQGL